MMTNDPLDQSALAALAETVTHTARHEEGLVKVTARPHGVLSEIELEPALHDLGAETAAAEILAVVKEAQEQADADFKQQVQVLLAASMQNLGGEQA